MKFDLGNTYKIKRKPKLNSLVVLFSFAFAAHLSKRESFLNAVGVLLCIFIAF